MDKKVIIIGSGKTELMSAILAEVAAQNIGAEVVTIEEAKERGLSQTLAYKALPKLIMPKYQLPFDGVSARNKRRKQERDNKKKR